MPLKKKYYSCEAGRSPGKHLQNLRFRGSTDKYCNAAALAGMCVCAFGRTAGKALIIYVRLLRVCTKKLH